MQSMLTDAVRLYRYQRVEEDQEDGNAVAGFAKSSRTYLITIRPMRTAITQAEQGTVKTKMFTAWTNDTHDFQEGDRLGDADNMIYAVESVLDNQTGQSMELSKI